MALLLYKSNEMFSSTELIRKSKMIFDKIVNDDIEKAIILRDGKPNFLLMDFYKYEKIMAEYEELKKYVEDNKKSKKSKKIKFEKKPEKKISTPVIEKKEVIKLDTKEIKIKSMKDEPQDEIIHSKVEEKKEQLIEETKIKDEPQDEIYEEQTVEEEIQTALESIKNMNFDDDMKKVAEDKIKAKIIKARAEREKLLKEQEENEKEDLKEELELQVQIKNEAKKKEQELKEFWD
ncbi:MAG: hypothetical protein U9Q33_08015 [Campylobacterota bacterium]|nr:hypothetical protein [Campylobacterota bacterium]